ncbi:MAG TPA: hypothetical protein GXX75_05710 [Clostridiales bacterium]|nr:hypothetical protein [Clostridiales bacterium]
MKGIDKLIQQARVVAGIRGDELDQYDFSKLTTAELIELAYTDLPEERFQELAGKARKEHKDEEFHEEPEKE